MNGQRKTIGRNFNQQASIESKSEIARFQYFTLKTGRKVKFSFITIPANDVEKKTFVLQETNGRDQSALTKASLMEIIKTIRFQQFFPCVGVYRGDSIEILDGSRRRAAAIAVNCSLDIMLTEDQLSSEEARQLAKDIQTAREHNLREIGLRLQLLKNSGMNQKEIAQSEGLSPAKVTRALQAASVSQDLISLFPVQSELTYADYKTLAEIDTKLAEKQLSYSALNNEITHRLNLVISEQDMAEEERKTTILKLIQKVTSSLIEQPAKDKSLTVNLWDFSEKDKFARKKIKGRQFSYEFNRLSKELQNEIDVAIKEILIRNFSE